MSSVDFAALEQGEIDDTAVEAPCCIGTCGNGMSSEDSLHIASSSSSAHSSSSSS